MCSVSMEYCLISIPYKEEHSLDRYQFSKGKYFLHFSIQLFFIQDSGSSAFCYIFPIPTQRWRKCDSSTFLLQPRRLRSPTSSKPLSRRLPALFLPSSHLFHSTSSLHSTPSLSSNYHIRLSHHSIMLTKFSSVSLLFAGAALLPGLVLGVVSQGTVNLTRDYLIEVGLVFVVPST